jgi:hypothetical protein
MIATHIYRCNDKSWQVDESDRVVIKQNGKDVVVGFNHGRCWSAALEEAQNLKK